MKTSSSNGLKELLIQAKRFYSIPELARELDVSSSTISRWLNQKSSPKPYIADRLHNVISACIENKRSDSSFRFVDLFAGIGGIRIGFENIGGQCVFTSESDAYAQRTYNANFPAEEEIVGDIRSVHARDVPDHDVLLAGFPCQPFSIAGVSKLKSLNRLHGFEDKKSGNLFFDVARIIKEKRPRVIVLENVKNLRTHDKGRTFRVIMNVLQQDLGYSVDDRVIDGQHWVPQHRERVIIVGFREPVLFGLKNMPLPSKGTVKMGSILHKTDGNEPLLPHDGNRYFDHDRNAVPAKYTLSDHLWRYLQEYAAKHRSLGHGFGFGLVTSQDIARTLSARYYKDGSEILVYQGKRKNPRRLTPREAARLMGFPDDFVIPVSDTRAYKQFGNSVVVPLFSHIAGYVKPMLTAQIQSGHEFGYS